MVYCEAVLKTMGAESRLVLGGGRVPLWWGGGVAAASCAFGFLECCHFLRWA